MIPACQYISVYYIAAILLKYGFDKVFKLQFYLPEPNILYSRFGSLHKDILYWSIIGLSHTYSVFTGGIELLTALLILIKRTRAFGFCLAMVVLTNILLINFSFDISVKTFTVFLSGVVVFNIYSTLKVLYTFFVQHRQVQLPVAVQPQNSFNNKWINTGLAIGLVWFIMIPYLSAGNFDDDHTERPPLHGAYQVTAFITGNDTLSTSNFPYKRFFIHRNNYIIFQRQDDAMADYFFEMDEANNRFTIQDYKKNKVFIHYNYSGTTGVLKLDFENNKKWVIQSKALNWKGLPALQDEMHYTIDEIR